MEMTRLGLRSPSGFNCNLHPHASSWPNARIYMVMNVSSLPIPMLRTSEAKLKDQHACPNSMNAKSSRELQNLHQTNHITMNDETATCCEQKAARKYENDLSRNFFLDQT